ncbi:MAG: hypothetical protein AB1420_13140 [Bacillota bacterium]
MSKLTQWIVKHNLLKPPSLEVSVRGQEVNPLKDGDHVVVVGGGIAGSAFARRLLSLAVKEGKKVKVTMVNGTSCNYCGGLITDLALKTFNQTYGLRVPKDVVLTRIKEFAYINSQGSFDLSIEEPMLGVLRTSRFGVIGFDDSFKMRILEGLPDETADFLTVMEPTIATHILPQKEGGKPWKVVTSRRKADGTSIELAADFVVLAGGLKMIDRPVLTEFQTFTGYQPPPLMPASVTEIDTSQARVNLMDGRLYIVDGIVPGAVMGLVSKSKNWLTLTSLGRELSKEDFDRLFSHPEVKKHLDLPNPSQHLRCGIICKASVYTGPAKNFYGDNWAAIGDLNGYGRVLKDGYLASLLSAKLAAETIIYIGRDKQSLYKNYFLPISKLKNDNKAGMALFKINTLLNHTSCFSKFFIKSAHLEAKHHKCSGPIHQGVKSLMTGDLPYKWIAALFVVGLLRRLSTPWEFILNISKK